jgi:hypothetical protein
MMTCNDGNMQEVYYVLFKTGTWHQVEKSLPPLLPIAVDTFFMGHSGYCQYLKLYTAIGRVASE